MVELVFFFNDTATTEIYTLSLHDALPISTPIQRSQILDPVSKHYWPFYMRDPGRAPLPWNASRHGGFTAGKAWVRLPPGAPPRPLPHPDAAAWPGVGLPSGGAGRTRLGGAQLLRTAARFAAGPIRRRGAPGGGPLV